MIDHEPPNQAAPDRRSAANKASLHPGSGRNQCPACELLFDDVGHFDRHRTGSFGRNGRRRCLSADELAAVGLRRDIDGFWTSSTVETAEA